MSGAALLGQRLEIFWVDEKDPGKGTWYTATVKEYRMTDKKHLVEFDDGDKEWYLLDDIRYRVLGTHNHTGHVGSRKQAVSEETELRYGDYDIAMEELIGRRVKIFWHDDLVENDPNAGQWFLGTIDAYDKDKNEHHVTYEDQDAHWYPLAHVRYHAMDVEDLKLLSTPRVQHHPQTMPSPRLEEEDSTTRSTPYVVASPHRSETPSMFDDVVDVQVAHDDNKSENAKSPKSLQGENQSLSRSGSVFNMDVPDPELSTQRAKIASLLQEVRTGKMEEMRKIQLGI